MNQKRVKSTLIVCLSLAAAITAIRSLRAYSFNHLHPPAGVDDIRDFAKQMPAPTRLYFAEIDGASYIVWIGGHSRPPIPASGPACYAFDSKGKLVDWRDETDEGHSIDRFYHLRRDAEFITIDDALRFVAVADAQQ